MKVDVKYVLVQAGKFIGTRDDFSGAFASPEQEQRFKAIIEGNSKACAAAAAVNKTHHIPKEV